ncbi:hypothetical protein [Traorella massiliensis]|uniref:hypothetical protein n=1 Tax=Traorella massiliensis TaxID=1903263 RepID=UPI00248ED328|nr:hypothetical protein [Traorella massiliensis]
MKKKQIIIFIISFILIVGVVAIISINNTNWVEGEEYLYTKAINYVVNDVEKVSDYKDKQDYQVFTDYLMYGIEKQDTKRYVYMWILYEEYYVQDNKLILGSGASMPYKFTFENENVIKCVTAEDGSRFEPSIREMFPDDIENLPLEDSLSPLSLTPQIESYYSYLPSTEIHYADNEE